MNIPIGTMFLHQDLIYCMRIADFSLGFLLRVSSRGSQRDVVYLG
jgi:hypothetical protein